MDFNNKKVGTALESVSASKDTPSQKSARKKSTAKTIIALAVDSLLVISAAAIGGVTYFKAVHGDKTETLTPYGTTIGTSTQNEDILLTLYESVADDYAAVYIFSIKSLTDAGKSLLINNTFDPDACQTAFYHSNAGESAVETLGDAGSKIIAAEKTPLAENIDCRLYKLRQQSPSGESIDLDIGLRCGGMTGDAINSAVYVIRPIESLCEEDCEYYTLYIISGEPQQLSLTFDGLEIPLPEAVTRTPDTEIGLSGCIQDYFRNEGGLSQIVSDYPVDAVLTPLGLYVNGGDQGSLFYDHAKLAFADGNEIEMNRAVQDEKDYSPSYYFSDDYKLSIYLFKDIMDISTVKSLVFYDDIEFPIDGGTPFTRSTGRKLDSSSDNEILWTAAQRLRDYITDACPVSITYQDSSTSKNKAQTAWSDVKYAGENTLCFDVVSDRTANKTDRFFVSLTDISGGTLEQEARAMIETLNAGLHTTGDDQTLPFNIIKTGTFVGTDLIAVDCGVTASGSVKRCFFAIYDNQLLAVQFDSYNGGSTYQAFDDLLELF